MINLVFIHGVNSQTTGYSNRLFDLIKVCYEKILKKNNLSNKEVQDKVADLIQKEIIWADVTTNLTNRYIELEYELYGKKRGLWNFATRGVDPLVLQILYYVKDKGDSQTGIMSILGSVNNKFNEIASDSKEFIVIAHSLGSVIAFDYLFGFRKFQANPKWKIDALVTLGAPIPLFISSMGHADSDLRLPDNVKGWYNIFDNEDGVARRCKPFFKNIDIQDIAVSTGLHPIKSHGFYWQSKQTAQKIAEIISGIN